MVDVWQSRGLLPGQPIYQGPPVSLQPQRLSFLDGTTVAVVRDSSKPDSISIRWPADGRRVFSTELDLADHESATLLELLDRALAEISETTKKREIGSFRRRHSWRVWRIRRVTVVINGRGAPIAIRSRMRSFHTLSLASILLDADGCAKIRAQLEKAIELGMQAR